MKGLILTFAVSFIGVGVFAQDVWTYKDSVNGAPRSAGATFKANSDGFVCGGFDGFGFTRKTYSYTLWQDDWDDETSLGGLNFDGLDRASASGFSLNNKGYICLGQGESNGFFDDLWEYDATSMTWTQKADFIGSPRREAVSFELDDKGYVGTGQDASGLTNDFYRYEPETNTWSQVADFGGTARKEAVGFTMGDAGYVGTGDDGIYRNDFWEYNPTLDQWVQRADFPGTARKAAVGWGMFPQAFICTGEDINYEYKNDLWEYNFFTDSWIQRADFIGPGRSNAIAFTVDFLAFVGMGYGENGTFYDDFYSYTRIIGQDELHYSNVNVYPNPTTDFIVIDQSFMTNELQIFNASGMEVTSEVNIMKKTGKTKVKMTNLNAGVYFIHHKKDNFVSRIVKR
jgi:N-acetylneuraminic acid mutarotase